MLSLYRSRSTTLIALMIAITITLHNIDSAEAAHSQQSVRTATCAIYDNNQLSNPASTTATDCAIEIALDGQQQNGYAFGKWGSNWLAIDADGNAWASRGRGWAFWKTVTLPDPEPIPGDADRDGIADEVDACVDSAENYNNIFDTDGCPDTLADLLNFASNDLNQYWQAEFDEGNLTYYAPRAVQAYTSDGRGSRAYNAYYSGYTHSIHYDTRLMNDSLRSLGDVAPIFILAHEYGHLVQANLGLLTGSRSNVAKELEADCLAGAYLQNANERGLLENGDAEEAMRQAYRVGDNLPETHAGAHGSPTQRAAAFELGFTEGADTCLTSF